MAECSWTRRTRGSGAAPLYQHSPQADAGFPQLHSAANFRSPPSTIIADKPLHLLSNRPVYINTLQLDLYFTSTLPPFLSAEATPQSYSWKPHLVDNSHNIVTPFTGFNRPPHTYDLLNNQNLQQSTLADH